MYVTSSTGPRYVFALDAKSGKLKWKYEPELPNDYFATVCCGLDNRGVAYANGKVFVGRLDARLTALAWLGMHNYTYLWLQEGGRVSPREVAQPFADLFLRGVESRTRKRK